VRPGLPAVFRSGRITSDMDSEADADSGKGRFEVKFKLGKFAGWEGSLAPARVECHSRRAGASPPS